jgi:hypothetical protein
VNIQDKPRFPWRGLMIDSPRHFIPLDVPKRNLDSMAAVKMNVFHWRLSDNQELRAESKKFPKLQFWKWHQNSGRSVEQNDLAFFRMNGAKVFLERLPGDLGSCSNKLDTGGTGAHDHKPQPARR